MLKKYNYKNKRQQGITLIALVVTIVVLLILAGVSINLVAGDNGIIKKAHDAKHKHELGAKKEQDDMDKLIQMADNEIKKAKNIPQFDKDMYTKVIRDMHISMDKISFLSVDELPKEPNLIPINKDKTVLLKREEIIQENGNVINNIYVYGVGGVRAPEDSSLLFFGSNKAKDYDFSDLDTSHVKNLRDAFGHNYCNKIDLSNWDTSNVTDMSYMFENSEINEVNLSNLDTANVVNMEFMFWDAYIGKINFENFNTSKVTSMSNMFKNFEFSGENKFLNLSSFDTGNVTNMNSMFDNSNIRDVNLSSFNTSNLITASCMFRKCYELLKIDVSNFNVLKLEHPEAMFEGLFNVKLIDLSNWELGENFLQGSKLNYNSEEKLFNKIIFPKNGYVKVYPGDYLRMYKYPSKFDRKMFEDQNLKDYNIKFNFDSKLENKDNYIPLNNEKTILLEKDDINKDAIIHGLYGTALPDNCAGLFKGYTGNIDLSGVITIMNTDLSHLLEDVQGSIIAPSLIYTNKLTDMSYMFNNCKNVNKIGFAGKFDNNINLTNIFNGIVNLKGISFKFCTFTSDKDINIKISDSVLNNIYIEMPLGWQCIKGNGEITLKKQ